MLLPEWHRQWGILMAWPHAETDWQASLTEAEACYAEIAGAVLARQNLLLLCQSPEHSDHIRGLLARRGITDHQRLHLLIRPYNDTWARDFGPLATTDGDKLELLDFRFNGWGDKFPADRDNQLNRSIPWAVPLKGHELVLEGGSLESDGRGRILTTRQCLLNPNRNPHLDESGIARALCEAFGAHEIWWLSHGHLEGDDTDAHIDTLARFCSPGQIAYVQCEDRDDVHYPALSAMQKELEQLAEIHDLELIPLPLPAPQYDSQGQRLPATHANFLIINGAVLVPVYNDPADKVALRRLATAFPDREIVGIDCRALIGQHGSLHCVTMQLPEGTMDQRLSG